jgi:uncharacterized protein
MSLTDTINNDIKTAMKSKDEAALRALRGIKSALLLAKTEKGAGDSISGEKELQILQKLVKQRKESLDIYVQQKRSCRCRSRGDCRHRTLPAGTHE